MDHLELPCLVNSVSHNLQHSKLTSRTFLTTLLLRLELVWVARRSSLICLWGTWAGILVGGISTLYCFTLYCMALVDLLFVVFGCLFGLLVSLLVGVLVGLLVSLFVGLFVGLLVV